VQKLKNRSQIDGGGRKPIASNGDSQHPTAEFRLSYQIQLQNAILKSICDFFHSFQGVFQELRKSDDTCGARAWNIIPYKAKTLYAATHAP
jgi:hypothetical protein